MKPSKKDKAPLHATADPENRIERAKRRLPSMMEEAAMLAGQEVLHADFEAEEFPIRDPDQEVLLPDEIILVVGKRRTGKTIMLVDMLYRMRHLYPYVFVFSKTHHTGYWQQHVPESCCVNGFDKEAVRDILRIQKQRYLMRGINPYLLLIFDDCAAEAAMSYSDVIYHLSMYGRHYKVGVWISTQHLNCASTKLRTNADKIILFTTLSCVTGEQLFLEFGRYVFFFYL